MNAHGYRGRVFSLKREGPAMDIGISGIDFPGEDKRSRVRVQHK